MAEECVILLHGLARGPGSMRKAERYLQAQGFGTANIGYDSRRQTIETLAAEALPRGLAQCRAQGARRIHFLTHSMGGILLRQYLATEGPPPELGRTVMLSPPSQGSEVVDKLGRVPGFGLWNGPAGNQMGTGSESLPLALGPASHEVGIITGNRSINLILSLLIPGPDDGKVSVARARLEGMSDFLVMPHTHTFIMRAEPVLEQVVQFLRQGRFSR